MADRPSGPIEAQIASLASGQHGVITRTQLLNAGLTRRMVESRVRSHRLIRLHRGVYLLGALVGPLKPARAKEMAAVLACEPDAWLSHQSAAALWELVPPARDAEPVHVTVAGADRGRRPGIHAHRVPRLAPEDRAVLDGVPLTAPARTLADLAGRVGTRTFEQAVATAERKDLVDLQAVATVMEREPGRRGASLVRRLIANEMGPAFTRSAAEERFLGLVGKGGLPAPEANARVEGFEVDFFWPSERVVAEVDGFAFHRSRRPFENDRRRDARLAASGFRVLRVTWRQLSDEPHVVLVRLAQILAHARASL